ncbi:hypothetical protein RIF29_16879 [Crotalaria pallida]|uniref:Uncharacterized protein n=1 Tax=Crotalaria pallida TaxID=3830 RepID=A0AAN9FG46_CROPI
MKGREAKAASSSSDLLVCFPSKLHLTLMPKPICSPSRPQDPNKRRHDHHHLKKSSTIRAFGQASPMIWTNTKSMGSEITEPTSPKVNCAGKIKVMRPKTNATKSWQSVMGEIEKLHNSNKQKKLSKLVHSLNFKKEVINLLTCFRGVRLDLWCFRTLNTEVDDEGIEENHEVIEEEKDKEASGTVFSKWLMVLQENQSNELNKQDRNNNGSSAEEEADDEGIVPPPNALLLMRCKSAPVKTRLKENEEKKNDEHIEQGKVKGKSLKSLMEENRKKENLVVMRYNSGFYNISSSNIAKETWIVGGLRDPLSKSSSCNK